MEDETKKEIEKLKGDLAILLTYLYKYQIGERYNEAEIMVVRTAAKRIGMNLK